MQCHGLDLEAPITPFYRRSGLACDINHTYHTKLIHITQGSKGCYRVVYSAVLAWCFLQVVKKEGKRGGKAYGMIL